MDTTNSIIIALIGSGLFSALVSGAFNIIQKIMDNKHGKNKQFNELKQQITDEIGGVKEEIKALDKKIDVVDHKVDENDAAQRRQRILRFADDIRMLYDLSQANYQSIFEDISKYTSFCETNPDFHNNMVSASIKIITDAYEDAVKKNKFV